MAMVWAAVARGPFALTVWPSRLTRPSAISFSASRREHTPTRAMILAMRSPSCELSSAKRNARVNDDEGIALALREAEVAAARGEVPVGAVLVSGEGEVLAADGNRIIERRDPTAHAEMLVIRAAAERLGNERLIGTTLYVTLEPCAMCVGAISMARIARLVFAAEDPKGGAVLHGPQFFTQATCHHRPQVSRAGDPAKAGELLRVFFRARRNRE